MTAVYANDRSVTISMNVKLYETFRKPVKNNLSIIIIMFDASQLRTFLKVSIIRPNDNANKHTCVERNKFCAQDSEPHE